MKLSKKRQQKYFLQRWEKFMHHFEQFSKRTTVYDVHEMRVELKKIKALLHFQEQVTGRRKKTVTKLIRKIFQRAGKIREAQVNAHLLKELNVNNTSFYTARRNAVAKNSRKLVKLVDRNAGRLVKANADARDSIRKISSKQLRAIEDDSLQKIRASFYPKLKINRLHASRKFIKRLVYLHGILSKTDAAHVHYDEQALRRLESATGKWHDMVIANELLRQLPHNAGTARKIARQKKSQLQIVRQLAQSSFRNQAA